MSEIKKLPIGIEFFREIQLDNFYYVDKTNFIRDLLRARGSVNLFTRPRRFGKSLNINMLKSFFEIGADISLFKGLKIAEEVTLCNQYLGKYPVISISLKDIEGNNYDEAYDSLGILISEEASRFDSLMESDKLTSADKRKLQQLIIGDFEKKAFLCSSLKLLTRLLNKHYRTPAIVLIDEYDVPLDKSYQNGYYPQMVQLIRSLFSQVLKTNPDMYFAVITGCLRIARESIFTGLNNFKVKTISDIRYAEYFGFTTDEVKELLAYYNLEEKYDVLKEWYDGYHFGETEIYCPWNVINQCDKFLESKGAPMELYWANSSSNAIIKDIVEIPAETTKFEIEALISGECIEKEVIPELTYADLDNADMKSRQLYLWSILYATGYLTDAEKPIGRIHKLVIPNKEVLSIFKDRIQSWFETKATSDTEKWQMFCNAVKNGNPEIIQTIFNEFMANSISIRDTFTKKEMKENFYHGMLLGLLRAENGWVVKSNTESGIGYTDIQLTIPSEKIGCIIEVKYAENGSFDSTCQKAIKQIQDNCYANTLLQEGITTIHKYGMACYKKTCKVIMG